MSERPADPAGSSRRAVLRALPTPVDLPDAPVGDDLWIQDAPPLLQVIDSLTEPRIADLDAFLREVDDLRTTIRHDLTLAATAAAAGEDELAGWLLLGEDGQVRSFEERALARLGALEASEANASIEAPIVPAVPRSRRVFSAAPFAAAAAVVFAFVAGAVPLPGGSSELAPGTRNVAVSSYAELTQLALEGASDSDISAAAQKFHDDLAPLVAAGLTDRIAAENAIRMLQSERAVLAAGATSSQALRAVLREADRLVAKLRASLARVPVRPVLPVSPEQEQARREQAPERRESSTKSSSSTKPSPTPTAKPSPTPSPTSTSASPQPSSSPTPTDPLPKAPTPPG